MEDLRDYFNISLQELELSLLEVLRKSLGIALESCLKTIDNAILLRRDSKRFKVKEFVETTIETILGQQITINRRYYFDTKTGKYVFLLDKVLGLPEETQVSPALAECLLHQAALTPSYRAAADSIEQIMGKRVVSHETVRQVVKSAGKAMEEALKIEIQEANGKHRVRLVFIETDALHVPLQNDKKRSVPEYIATIHEGWKPRTPGSKDYALKKVVQIRARNASQLWEKVRDFIYSYYDVDENTMIIINGDRASWIRKGTEYLPNALYQVDRYHVKRDLRRIFADSKVLPKVEEALDSDDVTGATFLAELAQAKLKLTDPDKAEDCQRLLNDLSQIADATVDYRKRLEARGISVDGLRGLGAGESQMSCFARRVKGKRSWSREGLGAMMELLCWRNTGRLQKVTDNVIKFMRKIDFSLGSLKEIAEKAVRKVVRKNVYVPRAAGTPIAHVGRTSSGGMSNLMHRLNEGGMLSSC
ncbi:MAG: ISLre2 family transposase [Limnochordia bacterium]|nr:ISLre2 family transposase [Limnochordia bacterium]